MGADILPKAAENEKTLKTYVLYPCQDMCADLEKLGVLPDGTKMFTTDATAMYTSIDLDHLLEAMDAWLKEHKDKLPKDFPTKLSMEALRLVMKSNVFSSRSTWWKQLIRTAMGMPCTCIIAMLYFGLFERHYLLQKYKPWLLCYCQFLDD
eukprot:5532055-Ditylum_brightwellii.AAC.1